MPENGKISPKAKLFTLNASSFLFNEATQQLFALNPVAAYIWTCIEDGFDWREAADALARDFSIPAADATNHVRSMLASWTEAHMLSEPDSNDGAEHDPPSPRGPHSRSVKQFRAPGRLPFSSSRFLRVLSLCFELRFTSHELEDRTMEVFQHLETRDQAEDRVLLDVVVDRDGIAIVHGFSVEAECRTLDEVVPTLKALITDLTIVSEDYALAFHAGGVSNGEFALLFVADGGSGKSTLTGALLQEGFGYLSDDIVLLEQPSHRVRGIPLPICVKAAGAPALRSLYPQLATATNHLRSDKQWVKYLAPPNGTWSLEAASQSCPVKWIVFPRYEPDQPSSLTPIDCGEALIRLLPHAAAGAFLKTGNVEQLASWIATTRCYELSMAELSTAIESLRSLEIDWPRR